MISIFTLQKWLKGLDKWLLFFVFALCAIGIAMVYSTTKSFDGGMKYILIQSAAFLLGLIGMGIIMAIDYETFGNNTKMIYAINIFLLVFVLLTGTGKEEVGGQSWLRFGALGLQPSELVKIGFALTLAKHLERVKDDINRFLPLLGVLLHAGILIGLVLLQPDYGTAMVYIFMLICMLYAAGLSYKYFIAGIGAFAVLAPVMWFFVLQPYQKERFLIFLNPEHDPSGSGYQVIQSKIAIGSGQLQGRGFAQGPQTQLGILPAKHTDFIFASLSEELGFLGAMAVLILLIAVFIKCILIAKQARDDYGSFICVGIGAMLLFHIFENIGMCVGVMPVTGIPLPFISYGGSYMLTTVLSIGLIMNVWIRRKPLNF